MGLLSFCLAAVDSEPFPFQVLLQDEDGPTQGGGGVQLIHAHDVYLPQLI